MARGQGGLGAGRRSHSLPHQSGQISWSTRFQWRPEAGFRVHAHKFRHTFARTDLRNSGDIERLRKILGHTTYAMVMRYVPLDARTWMSILMIGQRSKDASPIAGPYRRRARPTSSSSQSMKATILMASPWAVASIRR
jgi:Phage integrase family